MRIGFLVNPIAGMGGRVGLKGTDGKVEEARRRGADPRAPDRGKRALASLLTYSDAVEIVTWGQPMGAGVAEQAGFDPIVLGHPNSDETTAEDTRNAVKKLCSAGIDLLLFVGGDGTAVDIVDALREEEPIPILGVPAGVKVYSAVFAVTPEAAGEIAVTFNRTETREVEDLDEDAYREGTIRTRLHGVVEVPVAEAVQAGKQLSSGSVDAAVDGFLDDLDADTIYFLGPGGTLQTVKRALEFEGTPLGIDVWHNGSLLMRDAVESDLLSYLEKPTTIVVSPIGGQGFLFGRGNQQFSPQVIRNSDIEVIASRAKLDGLDALRVDTGDPDLDESLRGWVKVRVGRVERRLMPIV